MKIAVNTRLLISGKLDGIGWFTYETMKRITQAHPEHDFYFLFDRPFDGLFVFSDNVYPVIIGPKARHPLAFIYWFEVSVRNALERLKCDLFISPDGYLSLSSKVPALAVMHDLNFEHYPKDLPFIIRKFYRTTFPRYARRADRIVTVSEFSKGDIQEQYGIKDSSIDVAHNGSNEAYHPLEESEKEEVRNTVSDGKPYFVFIGSLHPRKNIARLMQAFENFCTNSPEEYNLILVGDKYYWNSEMQNIYQSMRFKDNVIFTGRLLVKELNRVVGGAKALAYVPYFEGFGIPILEAFSAGTPVITSNVTSMPEVAGDAALLVDPFSVDEIAFAMKRIATNTKLREELVEKGLKRSTYFSWDKTAEDLWQSVEKLASEKGLI